MNDIAPLSKIIKPLSKRFNELNVFNKVSWEQECAFSIQHLSRSPSLMSLAINDSLNVQLAVLNVAAIGISLNPALQHAYLVPRGGKICLDISFRGLIKIATDSGSIKWAKSELVYEEDEFEWNGVCERPTHKADIFGKRGKVIGGYCLAKLNDDSFMLEAMSIDDIKKIQSKSKAKRDDSPWALWWEEMAKKSIIKRAAKTWPQAATGDSLETAISVLNEHEGIVIDGDEVLKEVKKSGMEALKCSLDDKETENKEQSAVLEVSNYDLILDEIEAASNKDGLSICVDKITNNEDLNEDDKGKLRIAYQNKQKEIEDERNS